MSDPKVSARPSAKRDTTLYPNADVREAMRERFPDGMTDTAVHAAPFAYAIIEGPPGQWSAVCLVGVTAREIERLEPNGEAEPMARAMMRVTRALELRTIAKKWSKP